MLYCRNCQTQTLYDIVEKGVHHQAICRLCGSYIKNLPHDNPRFYVGKYKGKAISDIDDLSYLKWARDNMSTISSRVFEAIELRIQELNNPLLK